MDTANNCKKRVLILGKFGEGSGNNTTAQRIGQYLLEVGYECHIHDSANFSSTAVFSWFLLDKNINIVIGIHGIHAGKWLRGVSVPYCLIFGGTDVNEYSHDESSRAIISEAVGQACVLVAFSKTMAVKAVSLWPHIVNKPLMVIPQAVKTEPRVVDDVSKWKAQFGLPTSGKLFVLVAGLRPVKDPLYLMSAFSRWHKMKQPEAYFIIVGPQIDTMYSAQVLAAVSRHPGIIYIDRMSVPDSHRLIAESFALVNSSVSEGMSVAILEAMDLGVPVIARYIPGNVAIVENMYTGLLYHTPEEFIEKCELLLKEAGLRELLTSRARVRLQTSHNVEHEKQQYCQIVSQLVNDNTIGRPTELLK